MTDASNSNVLPCTHEFVLERFVPRRALRGVGAAEVSVDGLVLWMTRKDILQNIRLFGHHKELVKALEAYDTCASYSRS